jgi:glutathione S-transferase
LLLNSGEILTENIAILSWISDQSIPALFGDFVLHKSFKPYFTPGATEDAKASAGQTILKRLTFIAERLNEDYLLGAGFSVADAILAAAIARFPLPFIASGGPPVFFGLTDLSAAHGR